MVNRLPSVRIVEVGPRDGLQNIRETISTNTKLNLIRRLRRCGLKTIELTSFVSPRAVPQLADSLQLVNDRTIKKLLNDGDVRLPVLVPNNKGLEAALQTEVKEVAVFVSATEGFSRANIKCSVEEGLARARDVARRAAAAGLAVRGYVSCIFADPYDGDTPQASVLRCVTALLDAGCYEVSLGDTLGVGTPSEVCRLVHYLTARGISRKFLAGHFHDTYGTGVANVWEAYRCGIRVFDSSVAGLGGCPFAPGAKGNVATEDLVRMFHRCGVETGVDLQKLVDTGNWISQELSRPNSSRAGLALTGKPKIPTPSPRWTKVKDTAGIQAFRSGGDLKLILNRPEHGNALTRDMMLELTSIIRKARNDYTLSRLILTGRGKLFCKGVDWRKHNAVIGMEGSIRDAQYRLLADLLEAIDQAPQMTLACLNGPACGGGIGIAFACDNRLAVRHADLALRQKTFGPCLATIAKYVVREWGLEFARKAMVSGRPVKATELKSRGLISALPGSGKNISASIDKVLMSLNRSSPDEFRISNGVARVTYAHGEIKK